MLKAVIFDMDGVLVNSEPLHYEADRRMLSRLGITVAEGYLDRFVGVNDSDMWEEILREAGNAEGLESVLRAQKSLKIKLLKSSGLAPIEGVVDLLKALKRRGIPMAIASSSPAIFIKEVVEKLGVARFFDARVSGESVERGKPEPDVFLKAAERLGVDPAYCAAIEDSRNGTVAAKGAGMRCVGFRNPASGEQDLSAADATTGDFREITVEYLERLMR